MANHRRKDEKLTENSKDVLADSYNIAKKMGFKEVNLEHVFVALLSLGKGLAARFLRSIGVDLEKTIESIKHRWVVSRSISEDIKVSEKVKNLIKDAFVLAHEFGHVYVGTEHILLAFLKHTDLKFVKELEIAGLDFKTMRNRLLTYATYAPGIFTEGKQKSSKEDEAISYFGRNLNNLAKEGKLMPIIGREKEIDRLIRILSRHTKNNPILVGESGVGKTAVVEGLVQKIIKGEVPESIRDLEVYQIDLASIIAGSKVRGDVEQRLLVLISEVTSSPNKVLFIDEIHMIVGAGATGQDRSMDVANILKPRLTEEGVRVIGATTISEYREYFESDSALSRRFQPIMVEEIIAKNAIEILRGVRPRLEEYHGVKIMDEAVVAAVKLSDRYITDRFLPDKAIDVLDEAAAAEKLKREKDKKGYTRMVSELQFLKRKKEKAVKQHKFEKALGYKKKEDKVESNLLKVNKKTSESISKGKFRVSEEDVKGVISEWTNIPVTTLTLGEMRALRGIGRRIGRRIIGQKDAVRRVTATLKRSRLGISDARRPLASFLFLGPTGVGKTEMARVIAREFAGTEKALIQVDMSEYMEQHSVAKIIGAPPGYVGYQQGGHLTEEIRKRPYSVILFDEVEKAHPDLLNILLQILEEGHITDGKGRTINFKNTIIILTSNIGAEDIGRDNVLGFRVETRKGSRESLDLAYEKMRERLTEELKKVLRPEFINRIDEVVIFRGLDERDAQKITKLLLKEVEERLSEQKIIVDVDEKAVGLIARQGFSEEYGARNLRRKIQELVENPLADLILKSKKGTLQVKVTKDRNKLKIIPS
jgi:ATP-dependent Clp protease ATP-binding subunit ClpC